MKSERSALLSNISLVIGCLITFYIIYLSFNVPVKVIDKESGLMPINYSTLKPNYEDIGIILFALLGIILSIFSIYRKEIPKWRKYLALGLNLIWFLSYLILII